LVLPSRRRSRSRRLRPRRCGAERIGEDAGEVEVFAGRCGERALVGEEDVGLADSAVPGGELEDLLEHVAVNLRRAEVGRAGLLGLDVELDRAVTPAMFLSFRASLTACARNERDDFLPFTRVAGPM
jgi:hypothetical protein